MAPMSLLSTLPALEIVLERRVLRRADESGRDERVEHPTDEEIRTYRPAMADR
jgi:hypothetical protein